MNIRHTPEELEPACYYLRKSREDQEAEARGEGETLSKHRNALFSLSNEYNINFTGKFEEDVGTSGESLLHRPKMLTILKEVEEGKWKSVWCMEVDRLGRGDMQEQGLILETFKRAQTKIVTPRKVYDLNDEFDEEYTEFEAFMARKELKIITRRLQGGRIRSVKLDKNYIGTRPPYGYLIEKTTKSRWLIPHPDQAPVVQMIFELYTHENPQVRMGGSKIAKELNRLGKQTYTGKPWEASTVLFILKNEVYTGRLQWKKKEDKKSKTLGQKNTVRTRPKHEWIDVEGTHDPLVSKETFKRAQEILATKYHVPYQLINGITNPFAGLIKCAICGVSMVYRSYVKQKSHLICYNPLCANKSSRFDYVERAALEGLTLWLNQYKDQMEEHAPLEDSDNIINIKVQVLRNLEKELKELEQQKTRIHELLEKRIYDEETYIDRSRKLADRINETKTVIAETKAVLVTEAHREKARRDIIPELEKLLTVYNNTPDPAVRNQLLKSVLEYATYKKEKHQSGDDFTLVLYPRLPK